MAKWEHTHKRASRHGRHTQNPLRRRRIIVRVFLLMVCAALVAGVWYVTRLKTLTITTVDISGGTTIDLAAVEQKVQTMLDGSYFFLIPKRFAYTYPHDAISNELGRLSRVAQVTVARTSRTALSVAIREYTPYALWCADQEASSTVSNDCFFVSETGFAFAEAPLLHGATFLRYITEGRNPHAGASLASFEYIQATQKFTHALMDRHGMYVYSITETRDGDVHYRIREGGELLVAKDADIQKLFENLDAVLISKEFKHIASGHFVYIDLRFGNKVFVKEFPDKPKIESAPQSTHATTTEVVH